MSDIRLDELFPFYCSERDCRTHYNLADFVDIIQLWGFICLSSEKGTYLGFTCPNCCQTTIKKYQISDSTSLIQHLENNGIDIKKRYRGIRAYLRHYALFSVRDIDKSILGEELDGLKELSQEGEIYSLPDIAHPIVDYPWIKSNQNDFRIGEKAIPKLVEIENRFKVKVFPRIVGFSSIYKKAEKFLLKDQNVIQVLKNLIETQYGERRSHERDDEYYRDIYTDKINDDLSLEEYDAIFKSESYASLDKINPANDIINDYKKIRSRVDFELIYRDEFVNRLARSIFIDEKPEEPVTEKPISELKTAKEEIKAIRETQEEILDKLLNLEKRFSDLERIITQNPKVMELKCKVADVAKFNTDILLIGETGTGKELFARAIHQVSERKGNFVPLNCGSIPKDLFESELFGHKKGSFTGAISDKMGAFAYANNGTLFLDELGELPIELQSKLLRVIEYREVKPVGSEKHFNVDVKVVFATNRELQKEVDKGNFRNDLFFRINSPSFRIPPLREKAEDIPLLVDYFRVFFNKKFNKQVESISSNVINGLKEYTWLGNVRELMKGIEMAVINSNGPMITENELPDFLKEQEIEENINSKEDLPSGTKITDDEIRYWMKKLNNNKSQVAEKLGVTYRTILRRCKNLNL